MRKIEITLRTTVGLVSVRTVYGRDPESGRWLSPFRESVGLGPHETMTPVLEERVCFTATMTNSYEKASAVAAKWGTPVDDSVIHRHVQKVGARAEALDEERVERALAPETRPQVVAEAAGQAPRRGFDLVIMLDGLMLRERGPDWGLKPAEKDGNRVEWHELKGGIVYRLDQRAKTPSGRGMILEKYYVAYRGDPYEFGRRLFAEALRRGLHQARRVFVIADGALWIWNLVADRFPEAIQGLDIHHASHHLWAIAYDQFGEGSDKARAWVEPLLHQLKHGEEAGVLKTLEDLLELCRETAEEHETTRREVDYVRSNRDRLHYEKLQAAGCPIGSGAMESTCSQFQDRFKRTGQFWSLPGERCLMSLELARRNNDWNEVWPLTG